MANRKPARALTVRPYRPSDRAFYVGCLEGLQDHLVALDPFGIVQRGPKYGAIYSASALRLLRRNRGCLLVAELDGARVGFVTAYVRPRHRLRELELRPRVQGFVMDLYVRPEARGRGVGTALLRAAERRLAAVGCTHVWLDVFVPNRRAAQLYRSLGYRGFGLMLMRALAPEPAEPVSPSAPSVRHRSARAATTAGPSLRTSVRTGGRRASRRVPRRSPGPGRGRPVLGARTTYHRDHRPTARWRRRSKRSPKATIR